MSTKMDDNDWAHTLAVFRACLPRRGARPTTIAAFETLLISGPTFSPAPSSATKATHQGQPGRKRRIAPVKRDKPAFFARTL
jgi:hypothetical protein